MRKRPSVLRRDLLRAAEGLYRPFGWRTEKDPFWLLVAEVLLAKTPAGRVEGVWRALRSKYGSAKALSGARAASLEGILRPLGLQRRRASQLRNLAREWSLRPSVGDSPGQVAEGLRGMGVGPYAAAAFSTFHFGVPSLPVDANIARVFSRYCGRDGFDETTRRFATSCVPGESLTAKRFVYAVLDLGGTVCLSRGPRCPECPLVRNCEFAKRRATGD